MAQYAVPNGDVDDGAWQDTNFPGTNDLYTLVDQGINGGTPNTSNGIRVGTPGSTTCEMNLETLSSPGAGNQTIRVISNIVVGSDTLNVAIFDGATPVDDNDFTVNSSTPTTYSYTLGSTPGAYNDLRVKLTASDTLLTVYEVEFEIPDAGGGGGGGDVEDPTNPESFLMFL